MLYNTFSHHIHSEIIPPNKEELLYELENAELDDNQNFKWNDSCLVDLERLKLDKKSIGWFGPTIKIFFDELNIDAIERNLKIYLTGIWRNTYKKGYFQEVHDHIPSDLSGVVFLTDEQDGDGQFYFDNRHLVEISKEWRDLNIFQGRSWVKAERGKVILFPSVMLHGVSVHKTDNIRKTVSFNLKFNTTY